MTGGHTANLHDRESCSEGTGCQKYAARMRKTLFEQKGEHSAQDHPEVQFSARVGVRFAVAIMQIVYRIQAHPGWNSHKSSQI